MIYDAVGQGFYFHIPSSRKVDPGSKTCVPQTGVSSVQGRCDWLGQ